MGAKIVVENIEQLKEMFKQNEEGKFEYEVKDAMSVTEYQNKVAELEKEKKTFQDAIALSKESVSKLEKTAEARKLEREQVEAQLKEYKAFGDTKAIKDAIEKLKVLEKGEKVDQELNQRLNQATNKLHEYETKLQSIEPEYNQLKNYREETTKKLDFVNMQNQAFEIIDGMEGVNKKGLKRAIVKEYGSEFIRNEQGELVSKDGKSFQEYIKQYVEDYNYYIPNTAGKTTVIGDKGIQNNGGNSGDMFSELASMMK